MIAGRNSKAMKKAAHSRQRSRRRRPVVRIKVCELCFVPGAAASPRHSLAISHPPGPCPSLLSQHYSVRKTNTNLIFRAVRKHISSRSCSAQQDSPRIHRLPVRDPRHPITTTMCPFSMSALITAALYGLLTTSASLPAGEGPNRFSPATVKDWQPRRKSVSNACERCRRRKIRCDGDTPCATCKRFSLQCIRTQKPREVVASSVTPTTRRPLASSRSHVTHTHF